MLWTRSLMKNSQYEVQIATVKRNASLKNTKPDNVMRKEIARKDSIIARLIKQNQDGVLMRERLEKDLHHMRHTAVPAAPTSDEEEEEEENERVTNDSKITDEVHVV
ncbi:PREDICTED: uncharacterized protein LOC109588968 [Amphimedon queenslandica]|uniref:Uncharacterized protein n=1 Tax=Amphimedon queenslandica TaxID=400682 RepID=A0A1X7TAY8_AMPQE|nr:PREDICTED: uncharacterized protein LOC109588968 [Amphimedon queenslandica]|eukprot:XP_019860631.1 PREDICTED: uncharacterized protein LOC109588968 [Amphimedon queenslandica]